MDFKKIREAFVKMKFNCYLFGSDYLRQVYQ